MMIQENSLIKKYLPVDYKDCFIETMVDKPYMPVKELFNLIFRQYPQWILWLLKLRDLMVKPFGLKTNKSFEDIIVEENDNEIIIGTKDKHLTFHVSLFCSDFSDKRQIISISTFVKYENILGRIYFTVIWLFHRIIIAYLFKRAIRKWSEQL